MIGIQVFVKGFLHAMSLSCLKISSPQAPHCGRNGRWSTILLVFPLTAIRRISNDTHVDSARSGFGGVEARRFEVESLKVEENKSKFPHRLKSGKPAHRGYHILRCLASVYATTIVGYPVVADGCTNCTTVIDHLSM